MWAQLWTFIFRAVLYVAQGELALEEFMRQVKDYWTSFVVELVNYQQKTRLIKVSAGGGLGVLRSQHESASSFRDGTICSTNSRST
jgi:hypothetical protein